MSCAKFFLLALCIVALLGTMGVRSTTSIQGIPESNVGPASYVMSSPSSPASNATLSVAPNVTDLTRSLSQIRITVWLNNTNRIPAGYNSVLVSLSYDYKVLKASNLDYSSNVFSQFPAYQQNVAWDCLDGVAVPGHLCQTDDRGGRTTFGESLFGGSAPSGTDGNVFILTLDVNRTAPAFSNIQFIQAIVGYGQDSIPVTTYPGFYTSVACGTNACSPEAASFTVFPLFPVQENYTIFYGNSSVATGGAVITDYFWQFGDTVGLRPYVDSGTNSTSSYIYSIAGNYTVTLTITDSKGFKAAKSIKITVLNANVDMGIESLDVQPSPIALNPGIVFTITAILKNYGGLPENTSLLMSITINGKTDTLGNFTVMNMKAASDRTFSSKWDSSGFAPNVYRVDATTPLLKNEKITDKNPNHKSFWIQLIPLQSNSGLTLLSTAGLSVLVLGAGGAGVSFIRKRTRTVDDSL